MNNDLGWHEYPTKLDAQEVADMLGVDEETIKQYWAWMNDKNSRIELPKSRKHGGLRLVTSETDEAQAQVYAAGMNEAMVEHDSMNSEEMEVKAQIMSELARANVDMAAPELLNGDGSGKFIDIPQEPEPVDVEHWMYFEQHTGGNPEVRCTCGWKYAHVRKKVFIKAINRHGAKTGHVWKGSDSD